LIILKFTSPETSARTLFGSKTCPEASNTGVAVYELQDAGYYDTAAALATCVLIVIFAGNFLMKRITGGEFGF
jgi:ABC-type Fe3+ transport system permease subunit